jgi:hypothetical protein
MIDFSEQERSELRQYFNAIAEVETAPGKQRRVRVDRLEDMLISLGLAANRFEVEKIVKEIDDEGSGELDFEQFLMIVSRKGAHPAIFQVFKAMIDGDLGDRNLNFRTVISGARRAMIMDATGANDYDFAVNVKPPVCAEEAEAQGLKKQELQVSQKRGKRILENFANLQKTRFERGQKRGDRGERGEDGMPFDGSGFVPTGNMHMLWHTVCQEHNLVPSRPASADKRTLEPPRSPRDIIASIVQGNSKRTLKKKGTLVIGAPDSMSKAASSPELRSTSRPSTQEGRREYSAKPL